MGFSSGWRRKGAGTYCAILTAICIANVAFRSGASDPAKGRADELPAQLAVLKRFEGEWQTETLLRRPGPPSREVSTKGKAICQATLGGRYYEFRAETIPPDDSDLQVMTYDEPTGAYRQWVYSSDGYRHEATGKWDEKSNVLTWQGTTMEGTFVIEDHFVSADRLEWNLVRKDGAGKVVQTITGVVARASK
jgi:hypothetical protein